MRLFFLVRAVAIAISLVFIASGETVFAQIGTSSQSTTKKDTSMNKSNNGKWKSENANITYELINSQKIFVPDTSIAMIHSLKYLGTWCRDMGNIGAPALNLQFTPEERFGPTLGYHVFDAGSYSLDSAKYYNTNRPYSDFSYRLGSKLEQYTGLMHSQNIKPNWNVAVEYHKTTSAGYYKIERNNNDNLYLTSNYRSLNKHYKLWFALVYNKEQHDENGGISNASELDSTNSSGGKIYSDRRTIDVVNQNEAYSLTRSSVYNNMRQFGLQVQHTYIWGVTDTAYNGDSTQYSYSLKPRFSITHRFRLGSEKHTYNDLTPDSVRYASLFHQALGSGGSGYYSAGSDSVFAQQKWVHIDNKIFFNGYLGKSANPASFSAGIGNRIDLFTSDPVSKLVTDSLPTVVHAPGTNQLNLVHNYLEALIHKDALNAGDWTFNANGRLFITGPDAGDLSLNGKLGKQLRNNSAFLELGVGQQINEVPYAYRYYGNAYTNDTFHLDRKESVSNLFATVYFSKLKMGLGVKSYVINNYVYINEQEQPAQYTVPFSVQQLWIQKLFRAGKFCLDNQLSVQQFASGSPVNVPVLMGRHQLTYENVLFKNALKIVVGSEIRYNTSYKPAGYDCQLNRFFYQNTTSVTNTPEISFFVNFRVKSRFRAFFMVDQLQQLIPGVTNTILFLGSPFTNSANPGFLTVPVYATPDAMLRFGFSWILVN